MRITIAHLSLVATMVPLALAAGCGQYYTKKVVKFEDLSIGQRVPDRYPAGPAAANWTNFEVVKPGDHGLQAVSGTKGIWFKPGTSRASIALSNFDDALTMPMQLHAFSFGCFLDYPFEGSPFSCDLALTSEPGVAYHGARIHGFGPITFQPTNNASKGEQTSKLQRVEFTNGSGTPSGALVNFLSFNQALPGGIVLDNFEFCVLNQ